MTGAQFDLPFDSRRQARLRICRGPRAAVRALFEDLDRWLDEDPGLQATGRPIVVVVPSLSLREHLIARYAAHRGRAVLGLSVRTLFHLAIDLTQRSGPRRPFHPRLDALLARRLAAAEPVLAAPLGELRDGFATIAASVRDLLDAGLDAAHAEALDEALTVEGPEAASPREVERARAQVRVAAATAEHLDSLGVDRPSSLLARAAALVRSRAGDQLEPRALHVFGFSDATGAATDLLEAALDRWAGTLYLDHPPDPADRRRPDPGVRFTRRFHERLATTAASGPEAEAAAPAVVHLFRAPGAEAEIREVARRIHGLLKAGAAAEGIAVVARRLEPYRAALRHHLRALGVPYSGLSAGPRSPLGRRLAGILELVENGERTPVDRWLEIAAHDRPPGRLEDLRLALFQLGAGRLAEAAAVDPRPHLRDGRYRLPVRLGLTPATNDPTADDGPRPRLAPHRSVPGDELGRTIDAAARTVERLERLARASELAPVAENLLRLGLDELGWSADRQARTALVEAVQAVTEGLPANLPISAGELSRLLEPVLVRLGSIPLGGAGAGVRVLDVIEARSRTFEHLFIVGLNRGEFPRIVREDAALPDALRRVLSRSGFGLLPDLPRKLSGFDEERYLFAQLVAAAPSVTLSWQEFDDEGARRTVSPLVERLRWSAADRPATADTPPMAPVVFADADGDGESPPRPAREEAILAGLFADRERFEETTALALEEAGHPADGARALAAVRRRILDELDPVFGTPAGEAARRRLGPYLGSVGPLDSPSDEPGRDAGAEAVFVTRLERLAVCPWQTFLTKLLRLEPLPDPLELLPAIDPRTIGSVVHEALEALVRTAVPAARGDLQEVLRGEARIIERPSGPLLESLTRTAAERVLLERGVAMPGFARVLTRVVEPYLALALDLDWEGVSGPPRILGAEIFGDLQITDDQHRNRRIRFRADRVDLTDLGPVLTDYKTGGGAILTASEGKAKRLLRTRVARGEWLQAPAYALAVADRGGRGRYLLIRPELETPPEARRLEVPCDDADLAAAFTAAVRAALAVWDRGLLFPRLVEPDRDQRPRACRWCDVADACVQGDSAARIRLREWTERRTAEGPSTADERALLELWWLQQGGLAAAGGGRTGDPQAEEPR